MPDELDFKGIETGEKEFAIPKRAKTGIFRHSLVLAFGGSLVANVMLLTFFLIPIAMGLHVALLWLCLAWSVLGTGSLLYRTGAALLVWGVGILPIVPVLWLELGVINDQTPPLVILFAVAFPSYVAFWCYRVFRGSFMKLAVEQKPIVSAVAPRKQMSLLGLFRLMTMCAILLAIIPPIIKYFSGAENYEVLMLGALVVPNVFLLPTIRLTCGVSDGDVQRAFRYVLVLCAVIGVASVTGLTLVYGEFGLAVSVGMIVLLIYFAAGGFLIAGLSVLRDHRYRFGRPDGVGS